MSRRDMSFMVKRRDDIRKKIVDSLGGAGAGPEQAAALEKYYKLHSEFVASGDKKTCGDKAMNGLLDQIVHIEETVPGLVEHDRLRG